MHNNVCVLHFDIAIARDAETHMYTRHVLNRYFVNTYTYTTQALVWGYKIPLVLPASSYHLEKIQFVVVCCGGW